jgi:hypothetical protein
MRGWLTGRFSKEGSRLGEEFIHEVCGDRAERRWRGGQCRPEHAVTISDKSDRVPAEIP